MADQDDIPSRHSVSVAGVVINHEDRILAIKRADNGQWQIPGGVLELDESIEDGLRREIREETGVEVQIERLSGVYKNMKLGVVALVFLCRWENGDPRTSEESTEAVWMSAETVEEKFDPMFWTRVNDSLSGGVYTRNHDGKVFIAGGLSLGTER